jgi:hypothetical protein
MLSSLAGRSEPDVFSTFETFLNSTAEEDRVFLGGCAFPGDYERERFVAACCGMANGNGGWIIFGAEYSGQENEPGGFGGRSPLNLDSGGFGGRSPLSLNPDVFAIDGVADAALLERELRVCLRDEGWISSDPVSSFHAISFRPMPGRASSPSVSSGGLKMLLAAKVETADWFLRPLCVGANFLRGIGVASDISSCAVYRRVEGNDVMSGLDARFRMALDALERARDDHPVPGLSVRDLDIDSAVSFRRAVLAGYPHWANLSEVNFLKRVLVLDDDEKVTRAGQLLLGASPAPSRKKDGPLRLRRTSGVSSETKVEGGEGRFASNLWLAYSDILPELRGSLAENCADAVQECFMNALLHADYDAGRVEIEMDMGGDLEEGLIRIRFSNPGLPRFRGAGSARNYRLLRMFRLAGVVSEASETREVSEVRGARRRREKRWKFGGRRLSGLEIIRACDENFRLQWDTLEFFTHAELRLKRTRRNDEPKPAVSPLDWMPVVEEDGNSPEETLSRKNFLLGLKRAVVPYALLTSSDPDATESKTEESESGGAEREEAAAEKEEPSEKTKNANGEEYVEDEGEYLDEDEEMGFVPEFASLEELVRSTPRLHASIVRKAILEFCEEYRSLPALASALARSEISLRRHYISAMVREGLLEMEFPDRVGHPAQRYRKTARE